MIFSDGSYSVHGTCNAYQCIVLTVFSYFFESLFACSCFLFSLMFFFFIFVIAIIFFISIFFFYFSFFFRSLFHVKDVIDPQADLLLQATIEKDVPRTRRNIPRNRPQEVEQRAMSAK